MENKIQLSEERLKKAKAKSIESLFRTLSKNNYRLQQMIDRKANILISVNAIILSFIITVRFSGVERLPNEVPFLILLLSCLLSMILSLMSVRPFLVTKAGLGMQDNNLVNIETIKSLSLKAYKDKMNTVLSDDNTVYDAMVEDIFFIGKNIHRKHIILQLSATVFVIGLISAVCYALCFVPRI